jgi:hypothetical protein
MVKKNNKKIEEFSDDHENLEVLAPENKNEPHDLMVKNEKEEITELIKEKLNVRKGGNVIIGTVNVVMRPVTEHLKKRHEKFYKASKFHLAADITFVLIILALIASVFIFFNLQPKAQIDLQTTLSDSAVVSGQAETYTIQYANHGKVDIKDSTLSLTFPKNFVLMVVSPEDIWLDQTNTFKIGDLPRGANGFVKITGITYGKIGEQENITYSLNYSENGRAGNTLGSYAFVINSSVLQTSFTAPKEVFKNLDFGGKITLKNTGRADIAEEINLSFTSSNIVLKSIFSDKARLVNGVIIVNGLKAGESTDVNYEALSDAAAGSVAAILETDLNLDGQKSKQGEVRRDLSVAVPKFNIVISTDKESIKSDEVVNFKLKFVNQKDSAVTDAAIAIMPADEATQINNLVLLSDAKYKVNGNIITLGRLSAGESGEIDFTAVLHRKISSANQQTGIAAEINYQVDGRSIDYEMFSPKIKFISDLQISSNGLYYSAAGDQLGVGPLPPVVDVPTKYWIFWEINNSGNDLKNLTVSADLSNNIAWTGNKTVLSGDLRFGEVSRKMIWTVDDIAASGGNYRAGFEIELIPTLADVGKIPDLVSNIKYNATDTFTNTDISGSLKSITADLSDDPVASGKGRVVLLKIVK